MFDSVSNARGTIASASAAELAASVRKPASLQAAEAELSLMFGKHTDTWRQLREQIAETHGKAPNAAADRKTRELDAHVKALERKVAAVKLEMEPAREAYRRRLEPMLRPGYELAAAHVMAAKLLGVSIRQMERWRKLAIGPVHEPRGKWRGNVVRYQLAQLLAFRNRVTKGGPGTYQGVWAEWLERHGPFVPVLMKDPWPPPKLKRGWLRGKVS